MTAPECVAGCRCACNTSLCGCHDIAHFDRLIVATAAEALALTKKETTK